MSDVFWDSLSVAAVSNRRCYAEQRLLVLLLGSMAVMAGSLHPHKLGFVFVIYGPAWPLNTRSKQTKQLAGSKAGSMTNECV